jgi:Cof subfamily protein (haloacid dehalogenase superfamily)
MGYRLLAVDLDGTLLRRDGQVDDRDRAAIGELQAAGVTVTIVTGRLHSGAIGAAHACAIAGPIACVEGSHIIEVATRRSLVHHPMTADTTAVLRDAFAAHGLASFVFEADAIHHDEAGEPYAGYVRTWSPNTRVVEEALDAGVWANDPLAAVAIGDEAEIAAAHAVLRPHADRLFSVTFSVAACPGKYAVLTRAAGPTKGTALAALCGEAGCTVADAVAVGDWFNDVPMFEVAGRSFAMGSAPESVRAKATDELERLTGTGGGIAEAVRRAWG